MAVLSLSRLFQDKIKLILHTHCVNEATQLVWEGHLWVFWQDWRGPLSLVDPWSCRAMFGEQSAPVVTLGAICGFLRVTKCVCFSLQHPQTARPSSPSGGKERRECLIRLFHSERMTFLFYGLNKSQGKQFSLVVLYLRELNYCDIQTKIVCH